MRPFQGRRRRLLLPQPDLGLAAAELDQGWPQLEIAEISDQLLVLGLAKSPFCFKWRRSYNLGNRFSESLERLIKNQQQKKTYSCLRGAGIQNVLKIAS